MDDNNNNPPEVEAQGTIIRMPEEQRAFLERKLVQYHVRYNRYYDADVERDVAPEEKFSPGYMRDIWVGALYKIRVTERLLETGKVDIHELSRELVEEFCVINLDKFNNACAVLKACCSKISSELDATVPAEKAIVQQVSASAGKTIFMGSGTVLIQKKFQG